MSAADAQSEAVLCIAAARARCMELGLTPTQFAELLLPEALLAMMVDGLKQAEVDERFARFAREEIPRFFLQVKAVAGQCDCQREAMRDHEEDCFMQSEPSAETRASVARIFLNNANT